MSAETPDYVRLNRDVWTKSNARYTDAHAEEAWAQTEMTLGRVGNAGVRRSMSYLT